MRLILEAGGRHLLKVRMNSGESAEDLLSEPLKNMISSINFKNTLNLLPTFDNLTDAELYSWSVAHLINAYLETNQLMKYVEAYNAYYSDATCKFTEITFNLFI